MKALEQLEWLGYSFTWDGHNIQFNDGGYRPAPEVVRPLLDHLRQHREEVISFLRERAVVLEQMDSMEPLEWCRRWADLATRAGWPCTDSPSWTDWLAQVREAVCASPTCEDAAGVK